VTITAIVIALVLLVLSAILTFFMHKTKSKPNSVFKKSLFRVRQMRFFPVVSLAYGFLALTILFCGMLIVDHTIGFARYHQEDHAMFRVMLDRVPYNSNFPLVATQPLDEKTTPRILVIGDSFVWGFGVPNMNQNWWHIMGDELRRQGYDVEVHALGWSGTQTYDHLRWLRDTDVLAQLQPDLIVLGYFLNDADLSGLGYTIHFHDPTLPTGSRNRYGHGFLHPVFPSLYFYFDWRLSERFSRTENRFNNSEDGYTPWAMIERLTESPNIERFETYVVQPMSELLAAAGIPMIVIPVIDAPRELYVSNLQAVTPLFERAGFAVYNPYDAFVEYFSSHRRLRNYMHASPTDPHHGPASAWFHGRFAADVLRQHYSHLLGQLSEFERENLVIEINDWLPHMLQPQVLYKSATSSQYTIHFPAGDAQQAFLVWHRHMRRPYVMLNFRYPVRLSSISIEGENLRSAQIYTLGLNLDLGFDDQRPRRLRERNGVFSVNCGRYVTSLLIRATTVEHAGALLTLTIENQGGREAFF